MASLASANKFFLKTQLSKIVKSGGFMFSSSGMSDLPMPPIKGFSPLASSITKETKNISAKTINNDIIVDVGLNSSVQKIKKEIWSIMGSGIFLANN